MDRTVLIGIIFILITVIIFLLMVWIGSLEKRTEENHKALQSILDRQGEQRLTMNSDRARVKRLEEQIEKVQQQREE
jgi:predicted Holliday junction resolvase-like endonuclease